MVIAGDRSRARVWLNAQTSACQTRSRSFFARLAASLLMGWSERALVWDVREKERERGGTND